MEKEKSIIDGKLIFEGEYLNGEKHGKGKEYDDNGKLIFEGECRNNRYIILDNQKYNLTNDLNKLEKYKVKEYEDPKLNKLIFEGEYKNGKRWNGKGKEYNDYGKLEYEGDYLNGKRHGKGKEYCNRKLKFKGEYLNGKRHGKGIEYDSTCEVKFVYYLNGERQ